MNALSAKMLTLTDGAYPSARHWWGNAPYGGAVGAAMAFQDLLRNSTELAPEAQVPLMRYIHALMAHGSDERIEAWGHALRLGVSPNLRVPYSEAVEQYASPEAPVYFFAGCAAEFELFFQAGADLTAKDDFQNTYVAKVTQGNHNPEHHLSYSVDLRQRLAAYYQAIGTPPPMTEPKTAPLRYRRRW